MAVIRNHREWKIWDKQGKSKKKRKILNVKTDPPPFRNGLSNGGMASPGVISDLMQLHQPFLYRKGLQFAFLALSKCFQ